LKYITEIRITLEGLAGRLAAERITDAQLQMLRDVLDQEEKAASLGNNNLEELLQCDTRFHNIIY
jgi:DNA-binding GntR family transcriptional regulator